MKSFLSRVIRVRYGTEIQPIIEVRFSLLRRLWK